MTGTGRAGSALLRCAITAFLSIDSAPAAATPISLEVVSGPPIKQSENRPCIIGDPSCHNPESLPFTLIAPQLAAGALVSPTYTVGQIRNIVGGDTFSVGVDLNQARGHNGGAYTLQSFKLAVDGITRYSTSAPVTLIPVHFGNGFSDASVVMFDLSGLSDMQQVVFTASFSGGTAGREQFFLSPREIEPGAPVPEPTTMLLFGSGLAAIIAERRRRAKARTLSVSGDAL
jgi:PEP-CTERM motif